MKSVNFGGEILGGFFVLIGITFTKMQSIFVIPAQAGTGSIKYQCFKFDLFSTTETS